MKSQIIQIGNSQGIRIPKMLLEQSSIGGEVDLELHEEGILIRKSSRPRDGWDAAFRTASEDDGELAGAAASNRFDSKEWQW